MLQVNHSMISQGLDSHYKAVLIYAIANGITLPSAACQIAGSNLIKAHKAIGYWNNWTLVYVDYTDTTQQSFTYINWKNPASNFRVKGGTVNFTVKGGNKASGGGGYLNTGISAAALFTGNPSTSYSTPENSFANTTLIGCSAVAGALRWYNRDSGIRYETANLALAGGDNSGYRFGRNINSTHKTFAYRNGVINLNNVNSGGTFAMPAFDILIHANNHNGTPDGFNTTNTLECSFLGNDNFGQEVAEYNAWAAYKAAF